MSLIKHDLPGTGKKRPRANMSTKALLPLLPHRHGIELDLKSSSSVCSDESSVATSCSSITVKKSNRSAKMAGRSLEDFLTLLPSDVIRHWLQQPLVLYNIVLGTVQDGTVWTQARTVSATKSFLIGQTRQGLRGGKTSREKR
jgi:hypothetical protein